MFKNTFLKTIYTKRWMTITWSVGIALLVIFTISFFPTFQEALGESLNDVPESLRSFLGDAQTYSTIEGYTDLQIIVQMQFMVLIFGIILFTGVLAGEENDGTLQTLLAQPITRLRSYIEKLGAALTMLAIVCLSILLGTWAGVLLIGEQINSGRLLVAVFAAWLATLVFSSLGYGLGAATGKRGLSGAIAGAAAFTSLLISSLAESVDVLKTVDKLSPFHYFNKPGILQYGANWADIAVLAGVSVVFIVLGGIIFLKRDIYQK